MGCPYPSGSREHLALASISCYSLPKTRHKAFPIHLKLFRRAVHWRLTCEALTTTPRGTVGCSGCSPYMETAR